MSTTPGIRVVEFDLSDSWQECNQDIDAMTNLTPDMWWSNGLSK